MQTIKEILSQPLITNRQLEQNLVMVKEGPFAFNEYNCPNCGHVLSSKYHQTEPWLGIKECENCNSIVQILYQDRMGGAMQDYAVVWQEPNESQPFIDFSQINEFRDYVAEEKYNLHVPVVLQAISAFKREIRRQVKESVGK